MAKSKRYKSVSDYCKQNGYEPYQVYEILRKDKNFSDRLTVGFTGERQLPEVVLDKIGRILKNRADEIQRKRRTSPNSAAIAIADEMKFPVSRIGKQYRVHIEPFLEFLTTGRVSKEWHKLE